MIDVRHWAHAYLMYMLFPLALMLPLFVALDTVFSQITIAHVGFIYLVSAGIVLGYRVVAAHAHDELWREAIAAVIAVALFFVIPIIWGILGIITAGYLIYNRITSSSQRGRPAPQQRQPQRPRQNR